MSRQASAVQGVAFAIESRASASGARYGCNRSIAAYLFSKRIAAKIAALMTGCVGVR